MASKFKFGFAISGNIMAHNGSDYRVEYSVFVGNLGTITDRPWCGPEIVSETLENICQLTFTAYGDSDKWTGDVALHPMVVPVDWFGPMGYYQGSVLKPERVESINFRGCQAGEMHVERLHRWEESAAVLSFVARCLDYPDNHMSYAQSDKFDIVRDSWYSMDEFTKMIYTLRLRGAKQMARDERGRWEALPRHKQLSPDWLVVLTKDSLRWRDKVNASVAQLQEA